jgi:hypothetical protein
MSGVKKVICENVLLEKISEGKTLKEISKDME